MTTTPRQLVAIATYNERENLPTLVDAILAAAPSADVLVVDDNSPDGTGEWAAERAAVDARVDVLRRSGKLGLGSATVAAMRHAIDGGYDAVATLDADWSHPPDRLPTIFGLLDDVDVAIGSRYCPGGAIEGWPLRRRIASRLVNAAARRLLRLPIRDSSGAFRAYRVAALGRIDLGGVSETGYAFLEEILWRLHHAGATFAEAPITFRDREKGASKAGFEEVVGKLRMLASCAGRRP